MLIFVDNLGATSTPDMIAQNHHDPNYIQSLVGYDSAFNTKAKHWRREFLTRLGYKDQRVDMYAYRASKLKSRKF